MMGHYFVTVLLVVLPLSAEPCLAQKTEVPCCPDILERANGDKSCRWVKATPDYWYVLPRPFLRRHRAPFYVLAVTDSWEWYRETRSRWKPYRG